MTAETPDSAAKHPAADFDAGCFHCGLPLEAAVFPVRIEGVEHGTCCRGCQAVAQTIADKVGWASITATVLQRHRRCVAWIW